jgi:hypothetical protein
VTSTLFRELIEKKLKKENKMKTKKFNNKLSLNKSTIANLSIEAQGAVKGGNLDPTYTEPTFNPDCGDTGDTGGGGGPTQWCEIPTKILSVCVCVTQKELGGC